MDVNDKSPGGFETTARVVRQDHNGPDRLLKLPAAPVARPVTFMRVLFRGVDGQLVRPFYQMELLIPYVVVGCLFAGGIPR